MKQRYDNDGVSACGPRLTQFLQPRDWTFAFKSEDNRKAFKNKILQRVDDCDGCNVATWGIKVFTPVLMRMFGKEFDFSAYVFL